MNVNSQPPSTVAGYLLTRLAQASLISVFGVPGDGSLGLLDAVAAQPGLNWIAMATEQGAACAAGSYARLRGIGAVVTTSGAGELSAMSAIAGAYAGSVPVVHIVGTPTLATGGPGAKPRLGRPGRDRRHFLRMAAQITEALGPAAGPVALRASTPDELAWALDEATH